jgi:hypothetical protein
MTAAAATVVIPFPRIKSEAPRCAQCHTVMAICCIEPHAHGGGKEVHLYKCQACGLLDRIVTERE